MSLADVLTLLKSLDWEIRPKKGSHYVVTSPVGYTITISHKHLRVKRVNLKLLLKAIEGSGGA